MNMNQIINCDVKELADWAIPEYFTDLNVSINTVEDLSEIYEKMVLLTNQFSYLASILSYLKFYIRDAKHQKQKDVYESLIDKKEIIQNALETVKRKQNTLSRIITIKQEINKELNMNMQ